MGSVLEQRRPCKPGKDNRGGLGETGLVLGKGLSLRCAGRGHWRVGGQRQAGQVGGSVPELECHALNPDLFCPAPSLEEARGTGLGRDPAAGRCGSGRVVLSVS